MPTEINQKEKTKYYDSTYMWNQKQGAMNLSTKQKQIQRTRELTCGCQRERGMERDGLGVWGWQRLRL